jgi:response regulator RpfG family c-di-GMP phosphodiesterase
MDMSSNCTILIVDDQLTGRETLAALLGNQGYQLAFASEGAEALKQAMLLGPDLILLDVMMPGMDGFEVCRRIRATPEIADVSVIIVTALDDRDSRLLGIEAGADDYITKPFDRVELRARVRMITRLNRSRRSLLAHQQAEARAQRQIERLAALRTIDASITSSFDLNLTLNVILDQVIGQLQVAAAAILLRKPYTQTLEYTAVRGFRKEALQRTRLHIGEGCAGQAALQRRIIRLPDAENGGLPAAEPPLGKEFPTYHGVPLVIKGQVEGVLELFNHTMPDSDPDWLNFLDTLAGQVAVAIEHASLLESMQRSTSELTRAYDTTLEGWARALELRDKETEGHSQRVTDMAVRLGRRMGLGEAELVHVRRGALLHDIGKMGIPDSILLKPGPLSEDEWTVMRQHPVYAYDLLAPVAYLRPALEIPYCHHEKWDGTGYPRGLKGEQIPLAARIFAVVDVWDALRFDRPYRKGWPEPEVLDHIRGLSGTHLDPQVVDTFLKLDLVEEAEVRSTILIVDDHEDIVEAMRRALADLFTVFTATSGEEALEILAREEVAIVLTDQRMPDLTGVQLLERAKHIRPAALGILCSAYTDNEALTEAINLGTVRGFIPKPWSLMDLRRRVGEIAQQYRTAS